MRTLALSVAALLLIALPACSDDPGSFDPVSRTEPGPATLASRHLGSGRAETILPLTTVTDMPEGIAVNAQGDIFLGNRRLDGDHRVGQILRITPDHRVSVFARIGRTGPAFNEGLGGLVVDPGGNIYAAFISHDRRTHGVYRIGRRGGVARLPGSEAILLPDALALDPRGNLYVTDAEAGAVWRFTPDGHGTRWIQHRLLEPRVIGIGANGIAFVPPATLYVNNTEQNLIVRIPIRTDGRPGTPSVAASDPLLQIIDGLAADAHGDLYAAVVGFSVVGTAPIVRVDPRTGQVTPVTIDGSLFDWPTSLAFGRGPLDHQSLYVANSGIFEGPPDAVPGVVQLGVGVPGATVH